jgi:predicted DNA-binding ribbon-helix-helix protein
VRASKFGYHPTCNNDSGYRHRRLSADRAPRERKETMMKSKIIKRSVVIAQHKTSISLEDEFWQGLKDIARARQMTLSPLILAIRQCHQGNLSSAVRVFVFDHYRAQVAAASAAGSGSFTMIPALENNATSHLA